MADFTYRPLGGAYPPDRNFEDVADQATNRLGTFANILGAIISLALIIGIGVWGYKLLVRDVSGIPVVRVADGEMRIRPVDPGGQLAQHQGLSVNAVAARGGTDALADEVRLAPRPVEFAADDLEVSTTRVAALPQSSGPITAPEAIDLEAHLSTSPGIGEEAEPKETEQVALNTAVAEAVVAAVTSEQTQPAVLQTASLRFSLRPKRRPAAPVATIVPAAFQPGATVGEVDISALPAGTRLAQIGAFDTPEIARAQWARFEDKFDVYMTDKKRIIQKATSGGRTFYRLRVHGFEDIAAARRFCSALVAENADCIPVVIR